MADEPANDTPGTGNTPVPAEVPPAPQPVTPATAEPRTPFPPRDIGGLSMRTLTRDPLERKKAED